VTSERNAAPIADIIIQYKIRRKLLRVVSDIGARNISRYIFHPPRLSNNGMGNVIEAKAEAKSKKKKNKIK